MGNQSGPVDHYLATLEDWQSLAISKLRKIIKNAVSDIKEKILDSEPAYESSGPCCNIRMLKNHVQLEFWRGKELADRYGILAGNGGTKRHIRISGTDDIQEELFTEIVRQAAKLNRTLGDPRKKAQL
ncbi:MAG: DUF1801 domain-containing protein [Spirochaetales bacterium]|nr:DUF1801 domain-containing protein [Spirochaetales bacterium]